MSVFPDNYRMPFLVGIVGHRDLLPQQVPGIRAALAHILARLRAAYPDIPLSLLCPMAEGADLLAADVAAELGMSVVALLPLPVEVCRQDLLDPADLASFDRIMARAERLEVPLPTGVALADVAQPGKPRDAQFERAGLMVAQYSDLLIAVWDGQSTLHAAGTARVVEFRRRGRMLASDAHHPGRHALLAVQDNDLLYEIRCGRRSTHAGAVQAIGFSGVGVADAQVLPDSLVATLERSQEFNRDVRRFGEEIASNGRQLHAPGTPAGQDRLTDLDHLFSAADWLGGYFQRCFVRALLVRYVLLALMAFLLLAFKKDAEGTQGLVTLTGVLLVFTIGGALALWASRRSWHRKYLDYRALAEGLRVDFYWEIAGVRGQMDGEFAHERFLQKQDVELEWIRAAMRTVSFRLAMHPAEGAESGFAQARLEWIGEEGSVGDSGQMHYYQRRVETVERTEKIADSIGLALMSLSLVLAAVLIVDIIAGMNAHPILGPMSSKTVLWALALVTVYAGLFEVYMSEKADRPLIRQYRYMHSLFRFAATELDATQSELRRLEILGSLGHACLAEHAQWILANRDKRIQGMRW